MARLFRYSGNKARLFPEYLKILGPLETWPAFNRVVEPFLGAGGFSLSVLKDRPAVMGLGYDIAPEICALWRWLQRPGVESELRVLKEIYDSLEEKCDLRSLGVSKGAELYLKINVAGVYVGQWRSWRLPLHLGLPVENTIQALPAARRISVRQASAGNYTPRKGDFVFLDPPYAGTNGGYCENNFNKEEVLKIIVKCEQAGVPGVVAYGTDAPEILPELPWEYVCSRKTPRVKTGGTSWRVEWLARFGF